ncbi:hypothetical protein E2C01_064008 [Portunus trituberculatus]|uniref:Uncharacterized protein n=1 Tax=Portunus trituberculatus TaxID=210409 RepID=A0A5B7HM45_PORTR|nr:hypothetical protein [Portunus trituberculatus]
MTRSRPLSVLPPSGNPSPPPQLIQSLCDPSINSPSPVPDCLTPCASAPSTLSLYSPTSATSASPHTSPSAIPRPTAPLKGCLPRVITCIAEGLFKNGSQGPHPYRRRFLSRGVTSRRLVGTAAETCVAPTDSNL